MKTGIFGHDIAEVIYMQKTNRFKLALSKVRGFLRDKGLYVVILVCLALVGVAAFAIFGSRDSAEEPAENVSLQTGESLADVVLPELPATAAPSPVPTSTPVPPASAARERIPSPVSGSVIWRFARDELVYSETLSQWMTHAGVDVAAKKDAEVYSAADGVIERVFTDDALGVCVLINHGDFSCLYANLKSDPPVKEGRLVKSRAVIGYVGDTAISECALQSHLHLEVYVGGVPQDPEKTFVFEG